MNRHTSTLHRLWALPLIGSLALLLAACATPGIAPVAELAAAKASIEQAERAGARDAAPMELMSARDKFAKAQAAVREERFDPARRLAAQAEVDAELAERKARAMKAHAAAAELARSDALLRNELERQGRP